MSRPKCCRKVGCMPDTTTYLPDGMEGRNCDEVVLTIDEFEAIRLADYEDLYQEQAAARMNISRQTFGRIIDSSHKKIADVLINGKALRIEGGDVPIERMRRMRCRKCEKAAICPHCIKLQESIK